MFRLSLRGIQLACSLIKGTFEKIQKTRSSSYLDGRPIGASLTCPCTRCPATVRPGVSSSPCISGPNGSTSPVTSGSNVQVVLAQVFPM